MAVRYGGPDGRSYDSWQAAFDAAIAAGATSYGGVNAAGQDIGSADVDRAALGRPTTGLGYGQGNKGALGPAVPPEPNQAASSDGFWDTPLGRLAQKWYAANPGKGAAEYVASGQYAKDQAAAGAGAGDTPPPFNPFAPGEKDAFTGRSLKDIIAAGGFNALNEQEANYYLGGLPLGDTSAFLQMGGVNPNSGNPLGEFAGRITAPAAMAAAMQMYGTPGADLAAFGGSGAGQIAKNTYDRLAGGNAAYFSPEGARGFIDQTAGMMDKYVADPTSVGTANAAIGEYLKEPDKAFDTWLGIQGGNLSPFLRSANVREGLGRTLYDRYRQSGDPNQNYWRFLANAGR